MIKELSPELLVPVCLFYLVLRGLDTIEDDMTIPIKTKEPILRDFYNLMQQDGWTFNGCASREKDRELLVEFHYVVEEYKKIKPEYRTIITDITKRMGEGMADNAVKAEINDGISVDTVADYEKYCHYVAGLVGEGLTRLFVQSGLANPVLLQRSDLHESMGQFLQQTNIIRDIREDFEDKRRFWPKSVWSKYVDNFEDLFKPEHREAALRCSSEMVLIALNRATDCMFYMAGMKEQSVFNFAAIPQAMAISTLELCFRNPLIFEKNIKITKGTACQIMSDSSQDLKTFYANFLKYARKIHKKNNPMDPNFLKISVACAKVNLTTLTHEALKTCELKQNKQPDRTIHRNHIPHTRPQSHRPRRQRRLQHPRTNDTRTRSRRQNKEGQRDHVVQRDDVYYTRGTWCYSFHDGNYGMYFMWWCTSILETLCFSMLCDQD